MPKGTQAAKAVKRRVVASGIVEGKTARAVAKEAGCTVRHAQRIAAEPETQFLVREMLRPQRARLGKLASRVVNAIEKALIARRTDKADHIVRMRAVERYAELMQLAADDVVPELGEPTMMTWERFEVMYRSKNQVKDPA